MPSVRPNHRSVSPPTTAGSDPLSGRHGLTVGRRSFLGGSGALAAALALAGCSDGGSPSPPDQLPRASTEDDAPVGASGTVSLALPAGATDDTAGITAALAGFPNGKVTVDIVGASTDTGLSAVDPATVAGDGADVTRWFEGSSLNQLVDDGVIAGDIAGGGPLAPFARHVWGVFHRPSVFADNGWEAPTGLAEMFALGDEVSAAGLVPFATANAGGWEAMGWFDTLGVRLNGSAFHQDLAAGRIAWSDDAVAQIFVLWQQLQPYLQPEPNSRTWQQAAAAVREGDAAMFLTGSFVAGEFDDDDLDFFAFPELSDAPGVGALLAPLDGFVMAADPNNADAAAEVLAHLTTVEAQQSYADEAPGFVPATGSSADGAGAVQRSAISAIDGATALTTLFARATDPEFAAAFLPILSTFVADPSTYANQIDLWEAAREQVFG